MDDYRNAQRARWLSEVEGGLPPLVPAATTSASRSRKRPVADSDDEIMIVERDAPQSVEESDEALARRLQAEWNSTAASMTPVATPERAEDEQLAKVLQEEEAKLMRTFSNPGKDTTDGDLAEPTPDIHSLFRNYNDLYFGGKLDMVAVKWGPRMTLCAGLCQYEGKAGGCVIKLSEPILKYRTTRDLIDTLLHEMIHAYLFVASNKRDHEDHGPLFHEKMNEINHHAGTHISVYHNFRDEVDLYRVHWWKCQGKCTRIIKRAMNRAPGAYDLLPSVSPEDETHLEADNWWTGHLRECGGEFLKIKEPDPATKAAKKAKKGKPAPPITTMAPKGGQRLRGMDKWLAKGGSASPAPTVPLRRVKSVPRVSPPPPPLERRASSKEVIVIDSSENPPAIALSSSNGGAAPKEKSDEDSDDFRLIDRRGSFKM